MSTFVVEDRPTLRGQVLADSLLIFVTFIWGSTFVLVKDMTAQVPVMLFLAARFGIGGVGLALVAAFLRRWGGLTVRELGWSALTGVVVGAGYMFQTLGLQSTTASEAGFLTGLSVVLVPVLGLFLLRHRPDASAGLGVVLATLGLALLSLHFDQGLRIGIGDFYLLLCALCFAVQIILVATTSRWCDPLRSVTVQIIFAGLLNVASSIILEKPVASLSANVWLTVLFLGLVATAFAFLVQMSVQRFTTVTHTALIFALEPVFAATFGYMLNGEQLSVQGWAGAALIMSGMLVAELVPVLRRRTEPA